MLRKLCRCYRRRSCFTPLKQNAISNYARKLGAMKNYVRAWKEYYSGLCVRRSTINRGTINFDAVIKGAHDLPPANQTQHSNYWRKVGEGPNTYVEKGTIGAQAFFTTDPANKSDFRYGAASGFIPLKSRPTFNCGRI